MPHRVQHRTQHCAVRQLCVAVAAGQKRRGGRRKCELTLGCSIEHLVRRLGFVKGDQRQLDHIVPLSHGGKEHFTNYRLLPAKVHFARKSQATDEEIAAVALLELRYPVNLFIH